jgi:hypothetical protein
MGDEIKYTDSASGAMKGTRSSATSTSFIPSGCNSPIAPCWLLVEMRADWRVGAGYFLRRRDLPLVEVDTAAHCASSRAAWSFLLRLS